MPLPLDKITDQSLSDLLRVGYTSMEFDVFSHMITLGTIRSFDKQRIALKLNGLDLLARYPTEQIETLSLAVKAIDGVDYSEGQNGVQLRAFLENASDPVLSYIWDCYLKLLSVQRANVDSLIEDVKKKLENPLSSEPDGKSLEPLDSEASKTQTG